MKAAVLFSGQGQQFASMGADFYQKNTIYRQTIDEANLQLDWDLRESQDWFDDPERVPVAITAMNVGLYRMLTTVLPHPSVLSGLSLGEYGALIAAGVLSLNTGLKLVADRARYMQRASLQRPGQLVAALKVTPELVADACRAAQCAGEAYPANYNLTDQIVIGGDVTGIQAVTAYLKAHGVKRVVPLAVAVASHTPLMTSASEALAKRLQFVDVHVPQVPVISNTTVAPFTKAALKQTLVDQLVAPTHFADCLERIGSYEVDTVIQIGPGNNLAKFAQQILPETTVWSLDNDDDWQAFCHRMTEVHLHG